MIFFPKSIFSRSTNHKISRITESYAFTISAPTMTNRFNSNTFFHLLFISSRAKVSEYCEVVRHLLYDKGIFHQKIYYILKNVLGVAIKYGGKFNPLFTPLL